MKRVAFCFATLAGAALAQGGSRGSVPLGEVHQGSAMALADRLLPPEIRERVVEGSIRRQWSPGRVYWIGYRERGRSVQRDLCERMAHAVVVGGPAGSEDRLIPETPLRIGSVDSWREAAVLDSGAKPGRDACATARGYVSVRYEPERVIAAYRVLVSSMAAARRTGELPFGLTCEAHDPAACADERQALASLPIDALIGIKVSCPKAEKSVDESRPGVRLLTCRPLRPGHPYQAEVAFGMSGEDGDSWRVTFVHADRWPATIHLSRSSIVYH